jgi:hypothetical protein
VLEVAARLSQLAESHPAGRAMPLQIVMRQNPWPLPWYLRRLTGVGWWNGVSDAARVAPVVVVTPDLEPALVRRLYDVPPPGERELYVGVFEREMQLRPGWSCAYASATPGKPKRRSRSARGRGRSASVIQRFSYDAMNTTFEVRAVRGRRLREARPRTRPSPLDRLEQAEPLRPEQTSRHQRPARPLDARERLDAGVPADRPAALRAHRGS